MFPVFSGRRVLMLAIAALVAVVMVSPGFAQSTGMCKGKVVDSNGQPMEKAKVTIEFREGITRKYEVQTNKKGEFIQIGLPPGQYKVTAER
ncbi:MAG: carboxypeptidase regulatory-like domain-containing protein, partial [Acidobacteria bacterium]|nr:carboxypeptidase regulatory-like domain-containing protein [Acidobacteriota bacterium]